jgi:hypothetical protein
VSPYVQPHEALQYGAALAQPAAVPATKQPGCSLVSITPAAAYVGALQGRLAALTPNVIAKGAYVVALIPPGAPT